MSSFKNAYKGRAHRERSQPAARKKLGFLEKKQDYQVRAKNFDVRKRRLRALKRRAALRNPDEFNFGMVHSHLEDGVHIDEKEEEEIPKETLLKLKDQDLQLVRLRERIEKRKAEKLQSSLHLVGVKANEHVVYVDTLQEAEEFSPEDYFDTDEALLTQQHNRLRKEQLKTATIEADTKSLKNIAKKKVKAYEELSKRIEREKRVHSIARRLEAQRAHITRNPNETKGVIKPPKAKFAKIRKK